MNINPISFGKKEISSFRAYNNQKGQIETFTVQEYNYGFEDSLRIGGIAQRWANDNTQRENFLMAKEYLNSQMVNDETKKFFGIEDANANIKKLLVADLGRKYSVLGMIPNEDAISVLGDC